MHARSEFAAERIRRPAADAFILGCGSEFGADGVHTFSGASKDAVGNEEPPNSVTVRVDKTSPEATLASPTDGDVLALGSQRVATYSCSDATSGLDACVGTLAPSARIPTGTPGTFTFVVTATDKAGNTRTVTHTYYVAKAITLGPQSTEGNLRLAPGTLLKVGYAFAMPGKHPQATVRFLDSSVTFQTTCVTGTGGGAVTVPIANASTTVRANDAGWYPSGAQDSPLVYQGSTRVPDLCRGGLLSFQKGGTLAAKVLSDDATDGLNVHWHYSANGSAGGWSATLSVVPG